MTFYFILFSFIHQLEISRNLISSTEVSNYYLKIPIFVVIYNCAFMCIKSCHPSKGYAVDNKSKTYKTRSLADDYCHVATKDCSPKYWFFGAQTRLLLILHHLQKRYFERELYYAWHYFQEDDNILKMYTE